MIRGGGSRTTGARALTGPYRGPLTRTLTSPRRLAALARLEVLDLLLDPLGLGRVGSFRWGVGWRLWGIARSSPSRHRRRRFIRRRLVVARRHVEPAEHQQRDPNRRHPHRRARLFVRDFARRFGIESVVVVRPLVGLDGVAVAMVVAVAAHRGAGLPHPPDEVHENPGGIAYIDLRSETLEREEMAEDEVRIEVAGETNVGRKRNHNEDNFALMPQFGLYMVADGMGGHASGEVASKMSIDAMEKFLEETSDDPERTWPYKMDRTKGYEENRIITGVKLANLRIYEAAQRDGKKRGMGTTFVGLYASDDGVYVAHVGDSRCYRYRNGQLEALTEDHSLLNDYIKMKRLTPEEIEAFPHKNVIVRALGMKDTVKVDTAFVVPEVGDTFLLCSDGLAGPASDEEILDVLRTHDGGDIKETTSALIEKANSNGGPDNITAVLVRWSAAS